MSKTEKSERQTANRMGLAVMLLHLRGVLTDAEARRANERLLKWAAKRGIEMCRKPLIGG